MRWICMACLAAVVSGAWGQAPSAAADADEGVRVGGVVLSPNDLLARLAERFAGPVLEERIIAVLVEQKAQAQGIDLPQGSVETAFRQSMERVPAEQREAFLAARGLTLAVALRQIRIDLLVNALIDQTIQVTDAELSERYEKRRAALRRPERRIVTHITCDSEEAALRAYDDLKRDPLVDPQLTQIMEAPRGDLSEADRLTQAVFRQTDQSVRGVCHPVQLPDGWHVLRVEQVVEEQDPTLAECRDLLISEIRAEKREQAKPAWFQALRDGASVQLHIDLPGPQSPR
ncbi:MAG TPA: peptidyl-prolyl cis-trans isomerase [Armatimonadota bacterium]|nr:peptidyl-prolyl cis-trans isomerase [Armatimonadota bacterium]HQK94965.1 peptidyl-prolyl cis-trans isomerase [Armatimonadota bacterium]